MKYMVWLVLTGVAGGFGYLIWRALRRVEARRRASEERFASFMAQTLKPAAPKIEPAAPKAEPVPAADLLPQRLLLEAAEKAAQAGEPALSIQLYARLIARYPDGALAAQARAAVEQQKTRLARR